MALTVVEVGDINDVDYRVMGRVGERRSMCACVCVCGPGIYTGRYLRRWRQGYGDGKMDRALALVCLRRAEEQTGSSYCLTFLYPSLLV